VNSDLKAAVGTKVVRAASSLKSFAIELSDGKGLLLNAVDGAKIQAQIVSAEDLPSLSEAVCSVDWSWIYSSSLEAVELSNAAVRFKLNPVGPLTVSSGMWQGSPFLSFMPYKAAK
jgi:hypothetical protein